MIKILYRRSNFLNNTLTKALVKRFFLSDSYKCTEIWENRLKVPACQKIDFDAMYHALDTNFKKKTHVNVLDIDLLSCSMSSYECKNELEDVLLKLRLCPECVLLPERTSHGVIRWYLDNCTKEDILNLLSDRISFGMFPDYYLNNLLMNKFLVNKDPVSAVKIAVLQMLQEDFEHPITKVLALYSCYNYLASSDVWESLKEPEPDPDEEVQKIRVPFIRNPYFDDHFDISDTNHLVGKTLLLFGQALDGPLGMSSQLIGLVLYEKYEKCVMFLERAIKNHFKFYEEAVVKAKEFTFNKPKQNVEDSSSEEKEENKPAEEGRDIKDPWKEKVLKLIETLDNNDLIKGNLLSEVEKIVKKTVSENEKKDIELQCEIYKRWEKEREDHIQAEIEKSRVDQIKSTISATKRQLREEEEKLFFFEKEEEYGLILEEQEKKMNSVVYYKPKRKSKEEQEDVYVPPEVESKKN